MVQPFQPLNFMEMWWDDYTICKEWGVVVTETNDPIVDTSSNISKFNMGNTIIHLGWESC